MSYEENGYEYDSFSALEFISMDEIEAEQRKWEADGWEEVEMTEDYQFVYRRKIGYIGANESLKGTND